MTSSLIGQLDVIVTGLGWWLELDINHGRFALRIHATDQVMGVAYADLKQDERTIERAAGELLTRMQGTPSQRQSRR